MAASLEGKLQSMRNRASQLIQTIKYDSSSLEREVARAELMQIANEALVLQQLKEASNGRENIIL